MHYVVSLRRKEKKEDGMAEDFRIEWDEKRLWLHIRNQQR
jgi:hypothetical protein